ncbi:MAG: carbonic anhydrase [Parcubacteria group bacterium]
MFAGDAESRVSIRRKYDFSISSKCRTLLIQCIDYRFQTGIRNFMISQGYQDEYDVVSVSGAGKYLVESGVEREILFDEIRISQQLHNISEVFIVHHLDCGAYGGSNAFPTVQNEKARHMQDLGVIQARIKEKFPVLVVHTVIARLEADGNKVDFEKVA